MAEQNTEEEKVVPTTEATQETTNDDVAKDSQEQGSRGSETSQESKGHQNARGGRRRDSGNRRQRQPREPEEKEFIETLVQLNRVAKVVKGGRRFAFSALVVIGNKKGQVGYGFGKAGDVSEAIRKAIQNARKQIVTIKMYKTTIPHWVIGKSDTARVLLKPAARGAGIIAGGPVRIILELAGCSDILSKCMGSRNVVNVVRATFDGLDQILSAKEVAKARGIKINEIWS